jgi:acyl-CoA synthetase (AMP-forming)/AMP-acid ligase II
MSGTRSRSIPAPGLAPLVAPNAAALLRRNAAEFGDRTAIKFADQAWTHAEYFAESCRYASLFDERLPASGPRHVGVLLDNTPDYLFAFGGAALTGAAIVGLNHTRRGEHLLRDVQHTHCSLVITEPRHQDWLAPIAEELPPVLTSTRFAGGGDPAAALGESLGAALARRPADDPGHEPDIDGIWALIFTSGTSDAPKAVICSQRRLLVTGNRMRMIMDLSEDDVGYVCMPLFHSNAVQVGWAPSLVAHCAVGLGRRFSASGWLPDIRRYGATYFNYTGKPLAYLLAQPERPDDAENPLRVAFGNEGSPEVVESFAKRYRVDVIDAYGATEGGVAVNRDAAQRAGALGLAPDHVKIVDEAGNEKARAEVDGRGRVLNVDACVGEIVNTEGVGPFEGYYNNPDATEKTTRFGWYWSGDLGYKDADGYLYFAGRNADWIRVDGENFPAGPIEEALRQAPGVVLAAVYGVPDDQAGDQVMAGVVLRVGETFDAEAFTAWIDGQDAIGPKWRPRYIRVLRDPPTTGTNKIVKRALARAKFRHDLVEGDPLFVRMRDDAVYRSFTDADERALRDSFVHYHRERFWDL